MNRAFRYDREDQNQQVQSGISDYMSMRRYMQNYHNRTTSENGALMYETTTHPLLDLNFMVSSLRNRNEEFITTAFVKAYYETPEYAVKWLFFLRDILEGMGERRTFCICMKYLAVSHPQIAKAVMPFIPEYGRYDDLLVFLDTDLCDDVCDFLKVQLKKDLQAMKDNKPISLLGKWLPSVNTSSKKTRKNARILVDKFGMSEREYRKALSALRAYGNVVEVKMSASKWDEIEYEKVPAKATLKYDAAFKRHDEERHTDYLMKVFADDAKMNNKGIMPYEVVHRYYESPYAYKNTLKDDLLTELMWEKIAEQGFTNNWGFEDCIVVADGSGSMYVNASGSTTIRAIEVCHSLAIYFAEQLNGVFHNKAITFSERPKFIDLDKGKKLKEKLEIMLAHDEVANTNIEAVFNMLLSMAKSNKVPAEALPKQVLIISDMEFDSACACYGWEYDSLYCKGFAPTLFDTIKRRYEKAGYKMPRLIFWNVCGRTDSIPMVDNKEGICLLSGFSQNAMKIAADRKVTDPYESLLRVLDGPRYEKVGKAIEGLVA